MDIPSPGSKRISRRSLLAGAGVAMAGAAGLATAAARRGRDGNGSLPPSAGPAPTAAPSVVTASPTALPGPVRLAGGIARISAPGAFSFDTFDALRTGEPSVAEVLGRTHSRLLRWDAANPMSLATDLARRWEQPDDSTLVLHLEPAARWQSGRVVTAADIVEHLRRAQSLAKTSLPGVQRAGLMTGVREVSSPQEGLVSLELDVPGSLVLRALAARFALMQSPEAAAAYEKTWHEARPESVIGSGPFRFEGRGPAGELMFAAHRGGHRTPHLDGLRVYEPGFGPGRFLAGAIDSYVAHDRRDAAAVRSATGESFRETPAAAASPLLSTFFVGAPPWNNAQLRIALSGALNRRELARRLFGGSAAPWWPLHGAPVPTNIAGYRETATDDFNEARQRWEASGGPALGVVTIDIPSILDPLYAVSSVVVGMLNETLGAGQFRPAIETYPAISTKVLDGYYGNGRAATWFGWGPAVIEPDPVRTLFDWYHSSSLTAQANGARASTFDAALRALLTAPPVSDAGSLAAVAAGVLSNAEAGVLPWLVQAPPLFARDWLEADSEWPSIVNDHAATWLNSGLASFSQRPSR